MGWMPVWEVGGAPRSPVPARPFSLGLLFYRLGVDHQGKGSLLVEGRLEEVGHWGP
jgi:hypothetical protein